MRATWFIAGVACAIALAGCGAAQPQEAVTVTATPTIAPTPTPALDNDEQRVYEYISDTFPDLRSGDQDLVDQLSAGTSDQRSLAMLVKSSGKFIRLWKQWDRMDWVGGQVAGLEDAYDGYMRASARYKKNWLNALTGGNIQLCAKNAYQAESNMDKFGPRVEDELDNIESVIYGY